MNLDSSKSMVFYAPSIIKLTWIQSQSRRLKEVISNEGNMSKEEWLRGIYIQEIGLSESVITNLMSVGILTVWDLVGCDKRKILDDPKMGLGALNQILTRLDVYGLTIPD